MLLVIEVRPRIISLYVHFLFSFAERMGFGCLDDATVAKVRESLNNSVLPRLLGTFESFLSVSKSGWLANTDGPTIADFILVPRLMCDFAIVEIWAVWH